MLLRRGRYNKRKLVMKKYLTPKNYPHPPQKLERYGVIYYTESKCPACSGEKDNGGRLKGYKRKFFYLKCDRCKYTIKSTNAIEKQEYQVKKYYDKQSL